MIKISNHDDLQKALERINQLWDVSPAKNKKEWKERYRLINLVEEYESTHYKIKPPKLSGAFYYRLEHRLNPKDFLKVCKIIQELSTFADALFLHPDQKSSIYIIVPDHTDEIYDKLITCDNKLTKILRNTQVHIQFHVRARRNRSVREIKASEKLWCLNLNEKVTRALSN